MEGEAEAGERSAAGRRAVDVAGRGWVLEAWLLVDVAWKRRVCVHVRLPWRGWSQWRLAVPVADDGSSAPESRAQPNQEST